MASVPNTPPTLTTTPPSFFQKNRIWFIVIALFLLSNSGVYFYQRFQIGKLMKASRIELDKKTHLADSLKTQRDIEIATLTNRTLVWGIRSELERGNKGNIDVFLNKLVQETGLSLVAIRNANDSILLSTDKEYENRKYDKLIINDVQIKVDSNEVMVATPILSNETRLGTCFTIYKSPPATNFLLELIRKDTLPGESR